MQLIIAEKPDQARTLASVFKNKKAQGYIEILPNEIFPDGAFMTWAIGHLCELVPPEKYNPEWKKWTLATLPMIPSQFQYQVSKDKAKQFSVIKKFINDPRITEIIHAGDAGREGELIIRNILRLTKAKQPMKRLWISSLTPKAIKEGFRNLRDETETKNLYFEAYTRACSDWIVGMNASRLYSILLKEKGFSDVFSVGRVQTPTLALIVKRELEIEQFVSEPFWEVIGEFFINGKKYKGKWEVDGDSRIKKADMAAKIAQFCNGKPAEITDVKREKKEYHPPMLYNLSALQAETNRLYKFPPKKTLDILQGLYQKGIVSYPRSDSRYVTPGEADMFPDILHKISRIEKYAEFFPLPISSIRNNKRYVNEKKVTDHYAIIPTEQVKDPEKLSADEQKIYDLIIKSLLAAHYEKSVYEYTTVTTLVGGRATFLSKGKVQLAEGWRKVIPANEKDGEPELPLLEKGETGIVKKVNVKESKTQPPKRYTEGQLITLMKTAGKHIEDKELEKVLDETEGLGTEATRAGIITMLKSRKYIEIKKNLVYATAKAKILIHAIGKELLASPEMTAKWEQRLKEIAEGKANAKQFIDMTNKMITHLVTETTKQAVEWSFDREVTENFVPRQFKKSAPRKLGNCKFCDGNVIDKGTFYGCSNYQKTGCSFTISKKILGKTITQAQLKKLLTDGVTDQIQGFKSKDKEFNAKLAWDEQEKKIKFVFG
ncbi:DNA topoisomerase III [Caldifermentibacillus hisashii]|jgi:DNA topoisomerase-3|uniref:DNA topoisomerase n=1 Tax=Caldibacillus thermoamylovorans TaxID=35841 RepID=A0ABD4ACF4_9BACI|nr:MULTISPECIES: DNA topoisomerase III [Bacillaceae]KIO61445.1 DNA topoisomerase III [Caldibacillus thermoamylovorans]KIO73852.1 DNA topoisomerase III [Caldibacillus thermoamylovorans]MCM3475984.1 DNA topoisomerase III [Caldibacillus thermoamylovorans]PAC37245.1 DNA topoisomerase III [Caldifermentibacillus hisashii]